MGVVKAVRAMVGGGDRTKKRVPEPVTPRAPAEAEPVGRPEIEPVCPTCGGSARVGTVEALRARDRSAGCAVVLLDARGERRVTRCTNEGRREESVVGRFVPQASAEGA